MSTRRARIKAVTSLPPRRKNAESADLKNKQAQVKEQVEKSLKSPRTPRPLTEKNEVDESVLPPNISVEVTNTTVARNIIRTPNKNDKTIIPTKVGSPNNSTEKIKTSPKNTDNVSAITTSVIKSNKSIFASPQSRRNSPYRKAITSLLSSSPNNTTRSADINQANIASPLINKHTPKQQIINDNNELHITNQNINKITHNTGSQVESNTAEDYNVPSVPESIIDETVMDGIVPLQQAGNIPKPIDVLKSEIISENVEVLFDPIVPLPSPSKVRPKLRPAPRLGLHRRNSIQGSASESEDEARRAQLSSRAPTPSLSRQRHDSHTSSTLPNREVSRVRNDSVCSSTSQITAHGASIASPLKEKQTKLRRQEASSRRAAAMRRKREKTKRESLTMYDLIFYNPSSNPIVPDQDEIKAKEDDAKDAKQSAAKAEDSKSKNENNNSPEPAAAPAPQIKLGPNGEIVLDEQSLVIKPTDEGRSIMSVVREGAWAAGGGSYKRAPRTAEWSAPETVRFYRALAAIGTDFTLMAHLFPDRSRKDLKLKFKKEERQNGVLVDKALRSANAWDAERLRDEFESERAEARRRAAAERARLARSMQAERERVRNSRNLRVRNSRGSKALESTMIPGVAQIKENEITTADEIIERAIQSRPTSKKDTFVPTTVQPTSLPVVTQKTTPKMTIPRPTSINVTPNANTHAVPATSSKGTTPAVPTNIESGSLVVLTVNDPSSPSKKMLQTYIAHGGGRLTPVSLPTTLLNSVVGYMKKGTPKNTTGSPHFASPTSVTSQDSRGSTTPGVIQVNPSPTKRQRLSSFTTT